MFLWDLMTNYLYHSASGYSVVKLPKYKLDELQYKTFSCNYSKNSYLKKKSQLDSEELL